MILEELIVFPIFFATLKILDKLADPSFLEGVPTAIKIISLSQIFFRFELKSKLPDLRFFESFSFRPGS